MSIKKLNTTVFHQQTHGLVERFNKTLVEMLSMYAETSQRDWDVYLDAVLFAYNTSELSSTKYSPFFLMYGREARLPVDCNFFGAPKETITVEEFCKELECKLQIARKEARKNSQEAQVISKKHYDKNTAAPPYQTGDRVMVYTPHSKIGKSKKLLHIWRGPMTIISKTLELTWSIQIDSSHMPHHLERCHQPKGET